MKNLFNLFSKATRMAENLQKQSNLLPKNLGGAKTLTIEDIPDTTTEFIRLRNRTATSPEGGACILLLSMIKYVHDPTVGRHWMIIATDRNWLSPSKAEQAYKGFDLGNSASFSLKQIDDKKYLPYSYIKGATVANAYQVANLPYQIAVERSTDGGDGTVKVYVHSTGVETARPITMKKNDAGVWKGFEYSSIFTGIKAPIVKSQGAADGDF